MKLYFATGNEKKVKYASELLGLPVEAVDLEMDEIQSLELKEVAMKKLDQAFAKINKPVIIDDVSMEFEELGRLPGPFIRFFLEEMGLERICRMLDGKSRRATVRVIVGYKDAHQTKLFEGAVHGEITMNPHVGGEGFGKGGFSNIFIPDGFGKVSCQLDKEEYGRYFTQLRRYEELRQFLKDKSFDKPTIVLATASPYRARLLDDAGMPYVKILRPIDEDKINLEVKHEGVDKDFCRKYVEMLALEKQKPFRECPIENGAVITADTVVYCDGRILEKPMTVSKCREQHEFVSGKTSYFVTGYAVLYNGKSVSRVKETECKVSKIPPEIIEQVCAEELSLRVAGHRADEGLMKGYCQMDDEGRENWIGLCTKTVKEMLKEVGFSIETLP